MRVDKRRKPGTVQASLIRERPPEPTHDNPYLQIEWLVVRWIHGRPSVSQDVYRYAANSWITFLRSEHGGDARLEQDRRFVLRVHLDRHVIVRAVEYWRRQKYSVRTIYLRYLALRELVHFAHALGLSASHVFDNPSVAKPSRRVTDQRDPLDDEELEAIKNWLKAEIEYARSIAARMTLTDEERKNRLRIGNDPRIPSTGGWAVWDNLVWYLEHELDGKALMGGSVFKDRHQCFGRAASRHHGGLEKTWRRLGVTSVMGLAILTPLIIALALETGLNPDALLTLNRDCFQIEHPLTGLPCLRYYKERSKGSMELHVSLLGPADEGRMHLFEDQGVIIQRTIDLVHTLTEQNAASATVRDRNILFLACRVRGRGSKSAARISDRTLNSQLRSLVSRVEALEPVRSMNLARFRSTKIFEMVRRGADILSICSVAGHSHPKTTSLYLSRERILPFAETDLRRGFQEAQRRNREMYEQRRPAIATPTTQGHPNVVYEGPFSCCTNVYDPPAAVRRRTEWKAGQACTYWDMCLKCDNALVLERHLPVLVTYQDETRYALARGNLGHSGVGRQYLETLDILQDLLGDPDDASVNGIFPREAVDEARLRARSEAVFTDSVVHRGIRGESDE